MPSPNIKYQQFKQNHLTYHFDKFIDYFIAFTRQNNSPPSGIGFNFKLIIFSLFIVFKYPLDLVAPVFLQIQIDLSNNFNASLIFPNIFQRVPMYVSIYAQSKHQFNLSSIQTFQDLLKYYLATESYHKSMQIIPIFFNIFALSKDKFYYFQYMPKTMLQYLRDSLNQFFYLHTKPIQNSVLAHSNEFLIVDFYFTIKAMFKYYRAQSYLSCYLQTKDIFYATFAHPNFFSFQFLIYILIFYLQKIEEMEPEQNNSGQPLNNLKVIYFNTQQLRTRNKLYLIQDQLNEKFFHDGRIPEVIILSEVLIDVQKLEIGNIKYNRIGTQEETQIKNRRYKSVPQGYKSELVMMVREDIDAKPVRPQHPRIKGVQISDKMDVYGVHNMDGWEMIKIVQKLVHNKLKPKIFIGDWNIDLNKKRDSLNKRLLNLVIDSTKQNTWTRTIKGVRKQSKLDYVLRTMGLESFVKVHQTQLSDHKLLEFKVLYQFWNKRLNKNRRSPFQTTNKLIQQPNKYGQVFQEKDKPLKTVTQNLKVQYKEQTFKRLRIFKQRLQRIIMGAKGNQKQLWKLVKKKQTTWVNTQQQVQAWLHIIQKLQLVPQIRTIPMTQQQQSLIFSNVDQRILVNILKVNKTYGGDYINIKMLRQKYSETIGKYMSIKESTNFYSIIRKSIKVRSKGQTSGRMILLKKKHNVYQVKDNLRPIVAPAFGTRIIQAVLWQKLGFKQYYNAKIPHMQKSMKKDGMEYIMRRIRQWMKCKKKIITIDIKGAFDNITFQSIAQGIQDYQHRQILMKLVLSAKVRVGEGIYSSTKGVPQGTKLGPAIYNLATACIATWIQSIVGIDNVLVYADDIIWCQMSAQKQVNLSQLQNRLINIGLQIQTRKCQSLNTKKDHWAFSNNRLTNLGITYNRNGIDNSCWKQLGAKVKKSAARVSHFLRKSISWDKVMQKLSAIIVPQAVHILKAAKYKQKQLVKWIKQYPKIWRKVYGSNIPNTLILKFIPYRWRPHNLLTQMELNETSANIERICEVIKQTQDWTQRIFKFSPQKSINVVNFCVKFNRNMKAMKMECGLCGNCQKYGECIKIQKSFMVMDIYQSLVTNKYRLYKGYDRIKRIQRMNQLVRQQQENRERQRSLISVLSL